MDAIEAIRTRRSVRSFLDRPVERALIEDLIGDASHAPFTPIAKTGAWHFTAICGRKRLAGYGERALAYAREHRPQLAGYEWTERAGFSVFHGATAGFVISGRAGLPSELEECTRAGQIFQIAVHARGLGECWVGSPMLWLQDAATRAEFGIPEGWLPMAAFALGWADPAAALAPPAPRPPHLVAWVDD